MPVYNAEKYLKETIDSILRQTFTDFELLIINDGSSDGSEDIILSCYDKRIRYKKNPTNLKLIETLNKGIELSSGKYIIRMDADDVSLPQRLQKQVDFMEKHPDVGVCGSWFEIFGKEKKIIKYPEKDEDIRIMMLYQTPFCHPAVVIRKEILLQHNIRFSPDFIHAEDYEMWVRLMGLTRFANIQEVLLLYRLHESSVSFSNKAVQKANTLKTIRLLFQKIGMSVEPDDDEIFRNIAYGVFKTDKNYILKAKILLESLLNAKDCFRYLPEKELKEFVFSKWFHLCYNTTSLGLWVWNVFRQSEIVKIKENNFSILLKLYIRAVFKL